MIEAREWVKTWPVDWSKYHAPKVRTEAGGSIIGECSVLWKPRSVKYPPIRLMGIWISEDGSILQAGKNFGELVF